MVRRAREGSSLAGDARPVRDPGLRGDAAADAGRPRRASLSRVARALAHRGRARGRLAGRGDPRLAGARLQQARPQPSPSRVRCCRVRLARRPDRAAGRRPLHGGRDRQLRIRPTGAARGREHRPGSRAHRRRVRPGGGAGTLRPRCDRMPGTSATMCAPAHSPATVPPVDAPTSLRASRDRTRARFANAAPGRCEWWRRGRSGSKGSTQRPSPLFRATASYASSPASSRYRSRSVGS